MHKIPALYSVIGLAAALACIPVGAQTAQVDARCRAGVATGAISPRIGRAFECSPCEVLGKRRQSGVDRSVGDGDDPAFAALLITSGPVVQRSTITRLPWLPAKTA